MYAVVKDGVYRKSTTGNWENILAKENLLVVGINNNQDILAGGLVEAGVNKSASNPINFSSIDLENNSLVGWMTIAGNSIFTGQWFNPVISKLNINAPNVWQHKSIVNLEFPPEGSEYLATIGSYTAGAKNNGDVMIAGANYLANMDANLDFNIIADTDAGVPLGEYTYSFNPREFSLGNNDEILIVQHSFYNYIDFSTDGTTWSVLDPLADISSTFITDFHKGTTHFYVDATNTTMTFGDAIYYATDGINWNSIAIPNQTQLIKTFIDKKDNLYMFGHAPFSLYRLDLANEEWVLTNLDLHNDPNTYVELAFDKNNRMYALNSPYNTTSATTTQGISYSDDQGLSWTDIPYPTQGDGSTIYLNNIGFDANNRLYGKATDLNTINKGIYYFDDGTVDISAFDLPAINIYPNPVADYFNVDMKESGTYFIFDFLGRKIASGILAEGINTLPFPKNISNGIYTFSIKINTGTFTQKVIFKNK